MHVALQTVAHCLLLFFFLTHAEEQLDEAHIPSNLDLIIDHPIPGSIVRMQDPGVEPDSKVRVAVKFRLISVRSSELGIAQVEWCRQVVARMTLVSVDKVSPYPDLWWTPGQNCWEDIALVDPRGTHACTYTHMHAHKHATKHARTHSLSLSHTHKHTHTRARARRRSAELDTQERGIWRLVPHWSMVSMDSNC